MFEPDGLGTSGMFWLAGLTCLVLVAVVGHRIGARSWKHGLARVASVGVTTLCIVLAVTSMLNHTYGWYTSWNDLAESFTGDHPAGIQHAYGAPTQAVTTYDRAAAAHVNEDADRQYATERATFTATNHLTAIGAQGRWVKITVPGQTIKGHDIGRVMVWLPPGYGSEPRRTYPVIEAFHGMPGGTLDYERVFFLDKALIRAEREHHVRDAVVIVPQEMPAGLDTECVDGGGLNEETWLTSIVPKYAIQHLYVQADSHSWATLGVSAGGWCSMMAAFLHPDRYAAMVSLGGYFRPDFDGWNPFHGSTVPSRYDLFEQAQKHPTRQAIWLLISGGDKLSGRTSAAFARDVRAPDALTAVDYPGAGHRIDVWVRALPDVLSWLGKTLPAFAWSPTGASTSAATSVRPVVTPTRAITSSPVVQSIPGRATATSVRPLVTPTRAITSSPVVQSIPGEPTATRTRG